MFYVPELNLKGKGPLSRSSNIQPDLTIEDHINNFGLCRLWQASHSAKNVNRKVATEFKYEGWDKKLEYFR